MMKWIRGRRLSHASVVGRALHWFSATAAVFVLGSCTASRPTTVPMKTIFYAAPESDGPKSLLVILPGMRDSPGELVRHGFVRAVRDRNIAADIVIADAHFGYFRERSFEDRLRIDVIEPARARGYVSVWLCGISLGGFGSLLYASRNPGEVAGLITLAPFIAEGNVASEVFSAGGLVHWMPPPALEEGEFQRRLLAWLKGYRDAPSTRPPLYIGFGAKDRFAPINAAVGDLLAREHSLVVPGGHTWAAWIRLWENFLDRAPLPRNAGMANSGQGTRDGPLSRDPPRHLDRGGEDVIPQV
jgi:pimeloyl-ACP methyl ester carboxylesterase